MFGAAFERDFFTKSSLSIAEPILIISPSFVKEFTYLFEADALVRISPRVGSDNSYSYTRDKKFGYAF